MSPAVMPRRGRTKPAAWTPAKLPGAVAWWRADSIAGADGDTIASWTDRIAGQAVTQAGAGKPTLKLAANGINGQAVVRFASASSQYLAGALGVVPPRGPVYCFAVIRLTTSVNPARFASIEKAGTSAAGLGLTMAGTVMRTTTYGVADLTAGYGVAVGAAVLGFWGLSGTVRTFDRDNIFTLDSASASNANAGADTFTLGRRLNTAAEHLNGDIAEIVFTTTAPTTADHYRMARYVADRYAIAVGTPYNSSSAVTTASADASGTCVENSIVYFPAGWNGYKYWCAFVPYGSNNPANENPTILQSNDGNTWTSPAGAPVPVVAYPGGGAAGNNSDPGLFYNAADNKLYLFYAIENATPSSANGVWFTSSADGATWSTIAQVISASSFVDFEPKVVYNAATSEWWLFTIDGHDSANTALYRRVSTTSPVSGYGARALCSMALPGSLKIWHNGSITKIGKRYVSGFSDNFVDPGGNLLRRIWLASTEDGLNWSVAKRPILYRGGINGASTQWDNGAAIYRLTLIDSGDGINAWGWYSTLGGTVTTRMSQMITIPLSEIP